MYCGTVLHARWEPITKRNYVLLGGENAGTCLGYLCPSILTACSMLYTGLCVTMGGTTVISILYIAARHAIC